MILLDTNVLSALMKKSPDAEIVAWLDDQPPEDIWTTAISVFEIRFGLALLSEGRRRQTMEIAFEALLGEDLRGRIAVFDEPSAQAAAIIAARRQQLGRSIDFRDTQIAGIASARHATIATRNIRHFQDLDTPVVDPWSSASP